VSEGKFDEITDEVCGKSGVRALNAENLPVLPGPFNDQYSPFTSLALRLFGKGHGR
jgi:hypothetical protein